MRVHLGFFGITRSLRFTAGSIGDKLVQPVLDAGLELRRFGHFHLPGTIDNARSGEAGIAADENEAALLHLDRCLVEPQREELIAENLAACRRCPDHFRDGYATMRNLCFQLRSLDRLWTLMAPEVAADDWVLFARPDLLYLDRVDVAGLVAGLDAGGYEMAVPAWHGWGGLNDRFALCNAYAAEVYATRGKHLAPYAARTGDPQSERILAEAAGGAGLRVAGLAARAVRIRADGRAAARDLDEFGLAGAGSLLAA